MHSLERKGERGGGVTDSGGMTFSHSLSLSFSRYSRPNISRFRRDRVSYTTTNKQTNKQVNNGRKKRGKNNMVVKVCRESPHWFVDGSEAETAGVGTHQTIELNSCKRHYVKKPTHTHT